MKSHSPPPPPGPFILPGIQLCLPDRFNLPFSARIFSNLPSGQTSRPHSTLLTLGGGGVVREKEEDLVRGERPQCSPKLQTCLSFPPSFLPSKGSLFPPSSRLKPPLHLKDPVLSAQLITQHLPCMFNRSFTSDPSIRI